MKENYLIDKIKEEGFENIADFIKANLHYLPENKQKLFISIQDISKNYLYQGISKKAEYSGKDYYGKS
ncbi:MAG: hypothetical protein RBU23_09575 [Candidatus Auribacterota bacterium]|jgi:hypothetical protein|nr:hypothetical protein [Candidatus Auribacterota bacterium]